MHYLMLLHRFFRFEAESTDVTNVPRGNKIHKTCDDLALVNDTAMSFKFVVSIICDIVRGHYITSFASIEFHYRTVNAFPMLLQVVQRFADGPAKTTNEGLFVGVYGQTREFRYGSLEVIPFATMPIKVFFANVVLFTQVTN
jgi:hypothetical protein